MKLLELPTQLSGDWEHALILTYGADVVFFERAIRPQLAKSCRNIVILADGQHYLDTYVTHSDGSLLRHLNQRYVFDGIFAPRAAHAKLILLVNHESGRLFVGSGNLGLQGYASGGELFTEYDFSVTSPEQLPAFLAIRDLVHDLLSRGYIGPVGERHIQILLNDTPWLFRAIADAWQPIRHNLGHCFLDQIKDVVGADPVQELWILSPFLDEEAVALDRLLATLRPQKACLLIQPDWVSADPVALRKVQQQHRQLEIRPFSLKESRAYIHAKLYLLKLARRAICLQGSPNLSQVAMLFTIPAANFELANLLSGNRDGFDHLLQTLEIGAPLANLENAGFSYKKPSAPAVPPTRDWRLTGGEWQTDVLTLYFQGKCPDLKNSSLMIDNLSFELQIRRIERNSLEIKLPQQAQEYLVEPVTLAVCWGEDQFTNPVFVCNRAALDKELQSSATGGQTLHKVGNLEVEDEELENLLAELESALVIDERSIWQISGSVSSQGTTEGNGDQPLINYSQLDYEAIRRHPRVQQYLRRGSGSTQTVQTRLAIILKSITDHFNVLPQDFIPNKPSVEILGQAPVSDYDDESPAETTRVDEERRHRQMQSRIKKALARFVKRYLDGFGKPAFQQLVGFEVVVQNYAIFSHILWRILAREWIDLVFITESVLRLWSLFWGDNGRSGYFGALNDEQQLRARQILREYHADTSLLATMYWCFSSLVFERSYIKADEEADSAGQNEENADYDENDVVYDYEYVTSDEIKSQVFQLRDFWRGLLTNQPLHISEEVLAEAWYSIAKLVGYESPRPSEIILQLGRLCKIDTAEHFLRSISDRYGLPAGSCAFERVKVWREVLDKTVEVKCMVIDSITALANYETARDFLCDWINFEHLDYYRVVCPNALQSTRIVFYDVDDRSGTYFRKDTNEMIDFGPLIFEPLAWEATLKELHTLALRLDLRGSWSQAAAMQPVKR